MKGTAAVFLCSVAAVLVSVPATAESLNPENLRTRCGDSGAEPVCDGPNCGTCQGCHSSHFINSGPGTLSLVGLPDPYLAGVAYPLQVVLDDAANTDFQQGGFQISALAFYDRDGDLDDELCQAGLLEVVSVETGVETDPATQTQWLEQTSPQAAAGGMTMWDLLWRAPDPPPGLVTINLCAVAADGGGTTGVDWVYCSEFLVLPEVIPCSRFTLNASADPGPGDCESTVTWTASGNVMPTTYDLLVSVDGGAFAPVAGCSGLMDLTECTHVGAPWVSDLVYRVEGTDSCPQGARTVSADTGQPVRVTDTTPPSFAATGAAASAVQCDVTVNWEPAGATDACSGVAGFHLYRSDGSPDCPVGNRRGEAMDPGASTLPDTVPADGDYYYWVRAVDAAGNEEENCVTAPVSVTGCIGVCSEFLLELSATPGPGDCEATLGWTSTGNEGQTTYDLLYSRGGRPFRDVPGCTGLVGATGCIHTGAPWGDDLIYRVEGRDSCPQAPRSAEAETTVPVQVPDSTPPTFESPGTAASSLRCAVSVTWDPAAASDDCSGIAGFRIYRSDGLDTCPAGTLVDETGNPNGSAAQDVVTAIGEYFYWVRTFDAAGNEKEGCLTARAVVTGCNVVEPMFPQGGLVKDETGGFIILSWTETADAFNLYRGPLETVPEAVTSTGGYAQVECRIPGNAATDAVLQDGADWFYLVVPLLQDREQTYGCTDPEADGGCSTERAPAALPCP